MLVFGCSMNNIYFQDKNNITYLLLFDGNAQPFLESWDYMNFLGYNLYHFHLNNLQLIYF